MLIIHYGLHGVSAKQIWLASEANKTTVLLPTIQAVSRHQQTSLSTLGPIYTLQDFSTSSSGHRLIFTCKQTHKHCSSDYLEHGDSREKRLTPQLSELTLRMLSRTYPPKGMLVIQWMPLSHLSECFCFLPALLSLGCSIACPGSPPAPFVLSNLFQCKTDFKVEEPRRGKDFNFYCLPAILTFSFSHPLPYLTSDLLL